MAEMKFTKDTTECRIVNDFLMILQKYYLPEKEDSYWESLSGDLNGYFKKYDGNKLARRLANFTINYLEEKYKEGLKNG